jgi:hypothetical protein
MDSLPDDLKCKIFQELDAVHLCRLSTVSKSTGCLVDTPETWKIVHGNLKQEAKEVYLQNSTNEREAACNIERCKAELSSATTRALEASKEMKKIDSHTFRRRNEDILSHMWNSYNTAISDLNFAENQLEKAETDLEEAELEHWRVNGIFKLDVRKVRVPLRLRKIADDALAEWKVADAATKKLNPVFAGYLSTREKIGWKEAFEKERSTWWIARKAFREISRWEGKVTAADILMDVVAK